MAASLINCCKAADAIKIQIYLWVIIKSLRKDCCSRDFRNMMNVSITLKFACFSFGKFIVSSTKFSSFLLAALESNGCRPQNEWFIVVI